MKKVLKNTALAVAMLCAILLTGVIGLMSVNADDAKLGAAVVLSGSMEPSLSVNDIIFYVKQDDYQAGDIIVFKDEGVTSVHRIIKKSPDEIITKGDFNNTSDSPITKEQVIGKVKFKIPRIGAIFGSESSVAKKGVRAGFAAAGSDQVNGTGVLIKLKTDPGTAGYTYTFPAGKEIEIATYEIKSECGGKRKFNIKLVTKIGGDMFTPSCVIKSGTTTQTMSFVKKDGEANLKDPIVLPAGPYEATVTLKCKSSSLAPSRSNYRFELQNEMLAMDKDGNVITTIKKTIGTITLSTL